MLEITKPLRKPILGVASLQVFELQKEAYTEMVSEDETERRQVKQAS